MFPTSFEYHRATSVAEAVAMLGEHPDAKILAGGHSLIPAMKLRLAAPAMLVDLTRVAELKGVTLGDGVATIGAMTTYDELRFAEGIADAFPAIPEAINVIGDQQVRAHGTIGGALAHNDPAADLTAVFLALGGRVEVAGSSGPRTIDGEDLFVDLWTTSLEPDDIITRVILPLAADGARSAYRKHAHPASGYAVVGVAVAIEAAGGVVSKASIVVTGATSKPTHAAAAEAALAGKAFDADSLAAAVSIAADGLEINGDPYASEEYRSQLIKVLTRRALEAAMSR
ncbi:MAG: xanthine dehydrogenase family protein subunit M [Chloroflexia bacterium]|nr:xanthine dehydrogenase family protein subunit M [Chloroflexia bacterium]